MIISLLIVHVNSAANLRPLWHSMVFTGLMAVPRSACACMLRRSEYVLKTHTSCDCCLPLMGSAAPVRCTSGGCTVVPAWSRLCTDFSLRGTADDAATGCSAVLSRSVPNLVKLTLNEGKRGSTADLVRRLCCIDCEVQGFSLDLLNVYSVGLGKR